jgi:hypothetical protein
MSEVSIIRIDQLANGNIALSSPVMFGEGEFILKDTVSNLLGLLPTPDPNVRPRLQDLEITVLEENLETFLNTVDVTIAEGEIVFLRFGVIRANGFIGRETYAIPLSAGAYTPIGTTIPFSELILINQENFNIEGDANTIVYTFVSIGEINASDPATDFSDDTKEYIVILNNFPYLFIGTNDFYGEGESTMVDGDLQQLVSPSGVETVTGIGIDNSDPANPEFKGIRVKEFGEATIEPVSLIEFVGATVTDEGAGKVSVSITGGGGAAWGGITGTITDQTDLVTLVNDKVADSITDGVTTIAPSQNAVFDALAEKQDTLVSSANIKTINDISLLGSGNINTSKFSIVGFTTTPPITGVTGFVIAVDGVLIPGGTVKNGDLISIEVGCSRTVPVASNTSISISFCLTQGLTSVVSEGMNSTRLAGFSVNSSTNTIMYTEKRIFVKNKNNLCRVFNSNNVGTNHGIGTASLIRNEWNWDNDLYLYLYFNIGRTDETNQIEWYKLNIY